MGARGTAVAEFPFRTNAISSVPKIVPLADDVRGGDFGYVLLGKGAARPEAFRVCMSTNTHRGAGGSDES